MFARTGPHNREGTVRNNERTPGKTLSVPDDVGGKSPPARGQASAMAGRMIHKMVQSAERSPVGSIRLDEFRDESECFFKGWSQTLTMRYQC